MDTIIFNAYYCGMSEDNFAEKIMIYKPSESYEKKYMSGDFSEMHISELLDIVKKDGWDFLGTYGTGIISVNDVYIIIEDTLLGLQDDKKLDEIFAFFKTDKLKLAYFIVGGASINNCNGYRFTVHPDEDIHRNKPHVHVIKDNKSVRYSLVTLERFQQDKLPHEYKRDENKIILPFLKQKQAKLMEYWNEYMHGYISPILDEHGNQYYKES